MKKLITVLLTVALILSLAIVNVNAEAVNFAENFKWTQGLAGSISKKDDAYVATGITAQYKSPFIDLLPALKAALGEDDEVTVIISFDARATFTEGNEGESFTARVLFRGVNGLAEVNPAADPSGWNDAYAEAIDGDDPLFDSDPGGNLLYTIGSMELTDEDWNCFEVEKTFTATQINTNALTKWNLCVDNFSSFENIATLEFKNTKVILADEAEEPEETEAPEVPEAPETPGEKPAEPTATPTAKPEPTATAANLQTPDLSGTVAEKPALITVTSGSIESYILVGGIAGVVGIVIGALGTLLITKKKKSTDK